MPLNPRLLRKFFAGGAILMVLGVSAVYVHNLLSIRGKVAPAPAPIPSGVNQSAKGFTFSQSQGGRTLYTLHAVSAQQYKDGGRAELHDVTIIIYGREGNRADQISGSDFEYDPASENVVSKGEVQIDLQSELPAASSTGEMKNLIHVKTSGLTFNRKSGLAQTDQKIEFRIPEASGSAMGAVYDSQRSELILKSSVVINSTAQQKATITGQSAILTKDPRKMVLLSARVEQPDRSLRAAKITVLLRNDNNIDRILGEGNVQVAQAGAKGFDVSAPAGEVIMNTGNQIRSAMLSGGVDFERRGESPAKGRAGRVLVDVGPANRIIKARGEDSVELMQGVPGKSQRLKTAALDLFIPNGRTAERAVTSGAGEVELAQGHNTTLITAGQFEGKFGAGNHLKSVYGSPGAKVVSSIPGSPDRVSTSRDVTALFNEQGAITSVEQAGDFRYQEGTRTAFADHARYTTSDENIVLGGSPRIVDSGVSLTADSVQLNRQTGNAVARGSVKATYTEAKPQPGGALLASSDPIHITGDSMTANRTSELATFTAARLWRAADVVDAPVITFDRVHRGLQATANPSGRVHSVFVQTDKNGKATPVNVTSDKLTYVDADRKAVFTKNVLVQSAQTTMTSDMIQVFLRSRGNQGSDAASQLDHILAQGDIQIDQGARKATGNQLLYTAQDQKFVLTASDGKRPSIFDAEHGQITGDSLTFFSSDDRVLVVSKEKSQTLIQTRIRDASKK
jgi:lipopolysaccharide export system protein LptA